MRGRVAGLVAVTMPDTPDPAVSPSERPAVSASERLALVELLTDELMRTEARIALLTRDFDEIVEGAEVSAVDDEHDPEGATIGFERAQIVSLLDQARSRQAALEEARRGLEGGTFGRCEWCGEAVGFERLRVVPTATSCVACAAARSRRR